MTSVLFFVYIRENVCDSFSPIYFLLIILAEFPFHCLESSIFRTAIPQNICSTIYIYMYYYYFQKRKVHFTPEQASDFYSDHYGKIFFPTLISHMSSAPIVAMVLSKANAVKDWLELIGHVNPFKVSRQ